MTKNLPFLRHLFLALFVSTFIISCDKNDDDEPKNYDVPTTYTFTDENNNSTVDHLGQTQRLDMAGELITYLKTANTTGAMLDAQRIRDMYRNQNDPFTGAGLNASGKQIKDKVFAPEQELFETYIDSIVAASQSTQSASNGVAGVGDNGTNKYLFSANGFEYAQIIEKGFMGALMYYQATGVYLETDKMSADNKVVVDATTGKHYTQMEHHWDESFGYFGVPVDFPTNALSNPRYWGKYCDDRNGLLSTNSNLMDAYLKGRAAISNNDIATRDAQIEIIRQHWERVAAGTAVHYMNGAKTDFNDHVRRNHQLSEGYAFIHALKYNPSKSVTNEQIDGWLDLLGDNFYEVTQEDITTVRDQISEAFDFNSVKELL